jgi:hypothetical protein
MSSTSTPSQAVSNFDQAVTQCMSRVIFDCGSALNSAQVHSLTGLARSFSVNFQPARSTRGVGPAESTGKSSVRYWPGGSLSATSAEGRRPPNPRVTIGIAPSRLRGQKLVAALHFRNRCRPTLWYW